jgi:hypothetical protein
VVLVLRNTNSRCSATNAGSCPTIRDWLSAAPYTQGNFSLSYESGYKLIRPETVFMKSPVLHLNLPGAR